MGAIDSERAAHQACPVSFVAVRVFQRLDGADQHRAGVRVVLGHDVEAVVHAVDQVHVGHARRSPHERCPALPAAARMRGGIVGPHIRFGFDNPTGASESLRTVHERGAEQVASDSQGRPGVKRPWQALARSVVHILHGSRS